MAFALKSFSKEISKNEESMKKLTPADADKKLETGEYILLDSSDQRMRKQTGEEVPNFVFCKVCKTVLKMHQKSTSNLVKHRCYKAFLKTVVEEKKERSTTKTISQSSNSVNNKHRLTNLITKWMIKNCQSYELLQSEGLKDVLHELAALGSKFGGNVNVGNLLPNLPEARKELSELYEQCFKRLKSEITSVKEHGLSFTSDIWTDNFSKQSYVVLTVHFIKNGVFKFRLLGLRLFKSGKPNTNQMISSKVKQILEEFEYKLSRKSIIVTDSVSAFAENLQAAQHLPCLSQLLSNAILKSVEQVPEVLEIVNTCSNLVDALMKSENETLLEDFPKNSYCSPWLKKYKMLHWIEEKWSDIEEVLRSLNENAKNLSISVNRLRAVLKALQPFEEAIETLEDNSAPTLHLVIVYLHELKKTCDTSESEFQDIDFIKQLKENLRFHLEKIMTEDITTVYKIALFLFPLTNKLIQFNFTEKRFIEDECIRLMKNYKEENNPIKKPKAEPITSTSSSVCKRKNLFSDFMVLKPNDDVCDPLSQEIENYKNFDAVFSEDFDVCSWWQLHKTNFPLLYKLSCTVLATPATCAASKEIIANSNSLPEPKPIHIEKQVEREKIIFLNYNAVQDELESNFSITH